MRAYGITEPLGYPKDYKTHESWTMVEPITLPPIEECIENDKFLSRVIEILNGENKEIEKAVGFMEKLHLGLGYENPPHDKMKELAIQIFGAGSLSFVDRVKTAIMRVRHEMVRGAKQ